MVLVHPPEMKYPSNVDDHPREAVAEESTKDSDATAHSGLIVACLCQFHRHWRLRSSKQETANGQDTSFAPPLPLSGAVVGPAAVVAVD